MFIIIKIFLKNYEWNYNHLIAHFGKSDDQKTLTVQNSKTGQERNCQFLVINQHAT